MSVYVDPLFAVSPGMNAFWSRRYGRASHMVTDGDDAELHAFAERLGLQRRWFQDHGSFPHYDLTPAKHSLALALGAVERPTLELSDMLRAKRNQ